MRVACRTFGDGQQIYGTKVKYSVGARTDWMWADCTKTALRRHLKSLTILTLSPYENLIRKCIKQLSRSRAPDANISHHFCSFFFLFFHRFDVAIFSIASALPRFLHLCVSPVPSLHGTPQHIQFNFAYTNRPVDLATSTLTLTSSPSPFSSHKHTHFIYPRK